MNKRFLLSLALAVAVSSVAAAAEPTIQAPEKVPAGGMFIVRTTGLDKDSTFAWCAVGGAPILADLLERETLAPVLFVQPDREGMLHLVLAYLEGDKIRQLAVSVQVGKIDPKPDPDPDPDPPLPTPDHGPRLVWIVYESTDNTVKFGQLLTQIRQPPHWTYLASHQHRLVITDDDEVDENGNVPSDIAALREHFEEMTLPVLFIAEWPSKKVLHKQEIPADATATDVIEIVKKYD